MSILQTSFGGLFIELQNSISACLIGAYIGLMLYGIILYQAYRYFSTCGDDPLPIKVTVLSLLLAETLHSALIASISYYYLITNYHTDDLRVYSHGPLSLALLVPTICLIHLVCECFYARRVYLVGTSYKWLFLIVWGLLQAGCIALALVTSVRLLPDTSYEVWQGLEWTTTAAFACGAASDILITGVLIAHFYRQRTGLKRTDQLLQSLKFYAFSTGLVTSLSSIICLLACLLEGRSLLILALSAVAAKVYGSSVLVALNLRQSLTETLAWQNAVDWVDLSPVSP